MNTQPEEPDMPKALDTSRLRAVVDSEQNNAEGREVQIHTKAQQRLLADMERASVLDAEIAEDQDYALRLRNQLLEMQRLLSQTEANIKSNEAERKSCLESAHSLRLSGINVT